MKNTVPGLRVDADFDLFVKEARKRLDLSTPEFTRKLAEKQVLIFTILVDDKFEQKAWDEIRKQQQTR